MTSHPLVRRLLRLALVGKVHPNTVYRTLSSVEWQKNLHLTEAQTNEVMWTYMVEYHGQYLDGYDLIG